MQETISVLEQQATTTPEPVPMVQIKRGRGRPRKVWPDEVPPRNPKLEEGKIFSKPPAHKRKKVRKAELTATLAYLYFMQGGKFVPDEMPMNRLEMLFGVTRHTIYRCIKDVKAAMPMAKAALSELAEINDFEKRMRAERKVMAREAARLGSHQRFTERSAERVISKAKNAAEQVVEEAEAKAAELAARAEKMDIERRAMLARHRARRKKQEQVLIANGLLPGGLSPYGANAGGKASNKVQPALRKLK